jgi:hypothetical protein
MEVVSLVTGALSLSIQLTEATYKYITSVKDAGKSLRNLGSELSALSEVLRQMDDFLVQQGSKQPFHQNSVLVAAATSCVQQLECIKKKIERYEQLSGWRRAIHVAKWPLEEDETREVVAALHRCTQTFHFSLSLKGL